MIDGQKVLALIPARGGSKGIKDKNIINLAGKPLIAYTINAARESQYVDDVIVTTDSPIIRDKAVEYGAEVPFLRPKSLANDTAKTIDAVIHAIEALDGLDKQYDILLLLQPTQPLRNSKDIDSALELFIESESRSVVSICVVEDHPLLIRTLKDSGELSKLCSQNSSIRRQDMKQYYRVNGAIYINKINELNENTSFNDNQIGYVMPKIRSIDIDEPIDLFFAQALIENKLNIDEIE